MANYSHIFGSQFPSSLINVGTRKDVDDSILPLLTQYFAYLDAGDMESAAEYYEQNESVLEPYNANAKYLNRLEEEIYNTGVKALLQYNVIQSNLEPTVEQDDGSYWVKEYE